MEPSIMKKIILSVLLTFSPLLASAGFYDGLDAWAVTSDTTTRTVSGGFAVAASTKTWRNFVTRIDGTNGITSSLQITASSITATSPLGLSAPLVSSARLLFPNGVYLTSAPAAQYGGLYVSSNVYVPAGAFYYGDASKLTAITAANISAGALGASVIASSHAVASVQDSAIVAVSGSKVSGNISGNAGTASALAANGTNCSAGSFPLGVDASGNSETCSTALSGNAATASALAANPSDCSLPNVALGIDANGSAVCAQPSNVTGNAATVSNGVYTTGSYSNPAWITALAASKISAGALGSGVIASSVSVGAVQDASIVGVSGSKVSGNISGNAGTATTLQTARNINGVSFNGSADITVASADEASLSKSGVTFSAKSSSVTLQGNTFNGASQLVKLDGDTKLPAIDGSQLLNLPSTSGGAVLASTQTFTGGNTFQNTVAINTPTDKAYALTISSNGGTSYSVYISTNGLPKLYAYPSSLQLITAGTITKVLINTIKFDTHAGFNTSASTYSVRETGFYSITGQVCYDIGAAPSRIGAFVYVDGVERLVGITYGNDNSQYCVMASGIAYLHNGQYVDLRGYTQAVNLNTYVGSGNYTYLTLVRNP